jgi:hypothetical protein
MVQTCQTATHIHKTGQVEHVARTVHITEYRVSRYADLFCCLFSSAASIWTTYYYYWQINGCEYGAVMMRQLIWDNQCSKRKLSQCHLSTTDL